MLEIHDPTGARVLAPQASDVQVMIRAPASVTAAWGDGLDAYTITEVAPGDHLTFGTEPVATPPTIMVTAPTASGATYYDFYDGDSATGSVTANTTVYCAPPCSAVHDVVGFALATPTDPSPRWSAAPAQTLAPGMQITLGTWQPPATFTATYSGWPAGDTYTIQMQRQEMSSADVPVTTGTVETRDPAVITSAAAADTASTTYATTAFGGTHMAVSTTVVQDNSGARQIDQRILPAASTVTIDAQADLLPWIREIQFDPCTANLVTWVETAGHDPDGEWVTLTHGPRDPESGTPIGQWELLVRPGLHRVAIPTVSVVAGPLARVTGVRAEYRGATGGYDGFRSLAPSAPATTRASSYGAGH